jgi:hypothetical protein
MEDMPRERCPGCETWISVWPYELVYKVDHGTVGGRAEDDTESFFDLLERRAAAAGLRLALCDYALDYTCPECGRLNHAAPPPPPG